MFELALRHALFAAAADLPKLQFEAATEPPETHAEGMPLNS